jgi:hypothetical protein
LLAGLAFLDFMNDRTASILLFDQTLVSVYFCLFVAVAVTSIVSDRQLHQTLDEFKKLKIARVELGVNTYVSAASATTTRHLRNVCLFAVFCSLSSA